MVGKILIVDNLATNRTVYKAALDDAYYQTIDASDATSCLRLARNDLPDLVLLDLDLPDQSSIGLINLLRTDPTMINVPIIAFAAEDQADQRRRSLLAGADDVLSKPVQLQSLLARIRNLLRSRDGLQSLSAVTPKSEFFRLAEAPATFQMPAFISVIASQGATAHELQSSLSDLMPDTISIQSREDAFVETQGEAGRRTPDVFLIEESNADTGYSLRLLSELRSRSSTQHSAICILRPAQRVDGAAMAYDLGADDVISVDTAPQEIAARLKVVLRRKQYADQVRATVQDGLRLAMIDPLTGLHNRRYALPHLAAIAEKAAADTSVFAVMVIDLDKFKSVNDQFGHAAGDSVLAEVASRLRANLRVDDLLARIGGEEFLVALPDTNFEDAFAAADRLCRAIKENSIPIGLNASVRVTISVGLAISKTDATPEHSANILARADRALLKAKAEGRNKVTISKDAA